jgi:hypothetical protein
MQIEKFPPILCELCKSKNNLQKFYSVLSGENFYQTQCENNHIKEYLVEIIEVCPICKNPPLSACNCIQQTKTCKNNHSWMKCRKCKHLSIQNKYKHIVKCEKCFPTKNLRYYINIWKQYINI